MKFGWGQGTKPPYNGSAVRGGYFWDLETGKKISKVIFFDTQTCQLARYQEDEQGNITHTPDKIPVIIEEYRSVRMSVNKDGSDADDFVYYPPTFFWEK